MFTRMRISLLVRWNGSRGDRETVLLQYFAGWDNLFKSNAARDPYLRRFNIGGEKIAW